MKTTPSTHTGVSRRERPYRLFKRRTRELVISGLFVLLALFATESAQVVIRADVADALTELDVRETILWSDVQLRIETVEPIRVSKDKGHSDGVLVRYVQPKHLKLRRAPPLQL